MSILKKVMKMTFKQMGNIIISKITFGRIIVFYNPFEINLSITDECNLKCVWCVRNNKRYAHKKTKDMSFDVFKKIVDLFPTVYNINITGTGEPLLNKDIFLMLEYAKNEGRNTNIVSNGVLLSSNTIEMLFKHDVSSISVSLNAYDKKTFADVAGVSQEIYEVITRNLNELVKERNRRKSKLKISMTYVCTKDNYKDIPKVIELGKSICFDYIHFHNLIPSEKTDYDNGKCLMCSDVEVKKHLAEIKAKLDSNDMKKVYFPKLIPDCIKVRKCRVPFRNMKIDSEGNISSCYRVITPSSDNGNIFREKNVWNNKHYQSMRRMMLDNSVDLLECCKTCVEMA